MPRAANPFDYSTIADVLVTIDYTALQSPDYRQEVIRRLNLDRRVSAERPFSFRSQFVDAWYDLHNPDQSATPMRVHFKVTRQDFPPNVESLAIQHVVLYFAREADKVFEIPNCCLLFTPSAEAMPVGGDANTNDGVISTRRGNAPRWTPMIGKQPCGQWELTLPDTEEVRGRFANEEIEDILFVITYGGLTPEWPR